MSKLVLTEDQIQGQIVDGLRALGYVVLITSRRRKKCPFCGKYASGGDGADKGVPDLLVADKDDRDYTWVGLEVKRPGGKWSSPEQKELAGQKWTARVESFDQAVRVLAEIGLMSPRNPK